jgi:hypothetical protein
MIRTAPRSLVPVVLLSAIAAAQAARSSTSLPGDGR